MTFFDLNFSQDLNLIKLAHLKMFLALVVEKFLAAYIANAEEVFLELRNFFD